jgi:outer membrane protein assembly factor BamB
VVRVTGPREILSRRRALASLGVLAGLTGAGCASSKAGTPGVTAFPDSSVGGTMVAAGGLLYAGFQDGVVRALSPATGAGVWQRRTGGEVFDVTPGPRVVYVSDAFPPGTIYAIWA